MKSSILKNIMLLTFGSILALHVQVSQASDTADVKTTTEDEECIIKDGE